MEAQSIGPIPGTAQYDAQLSNRQESSYLTKMFMAGAWGITAGGIFAQALNPKVNWFTHFTLLNIPVLNYMVFTKTLACPSNSEMNCNVKKAIEKVWKVAAICFACGVVGSVLTNCYSDPFSKPMYSEELQNTIMIYQLMLSFGHFISAAGLKTAQPKTTEDKQFSSQNLIPVIEKLKEENEIWNANFIKLEQFINDNPDLVESFYKSKEETKHILLKPYKKGESESSDPIVTEWTNQCYQQLAYEAKFKRLLDFLTKNPTFANLLKDKLDKTNQKALLEKPKSS